MVISAILVSGCMLLLSLVLRVGRHLVARGLTDRAPGQATLGRVFDAVTRFLTRGVQGTLVVALVVLVVVWLTGPAAGAIRLRHARHDAIAVFVGHRVPEPFRASARANRTALLGAIGVLTVLVLVLLPGLSVAGAVLVVLAAAMGAAVVVASGRPPEPVLTKDGHEQEPTLGH